MHVKCGLDSDIPYGKGIISNIQDNVYRSWKGYFRGKNVKLRVGMFQKITLIYANTSEINSSPYPTYTTTITKNLFPKQDQK